MSVQYRLPRTSKKLVVKFKYSESFSWEPGYLPSWASNEDEYMPIVLNTSSPEAINLTVRMLAHDALEHVGLGTLTSNPYAEELVAQGTTMYHRREDFYNGFGTDGLGSEVIEHLLGLIDGDTYSEVMQSFNEAYQEKPIYYKGEVYEELKCAWDDILQHVRHNCQNPRLKTCILEEDISKHRLLRLTSAWMSVGYVRAQRIDNKYGNYSFSYGWSRLKQVLEESSHAIADMVYTGYYPDLLLSVDFKERMATVKIDVSDLDDEERKYLKYDHKLKFQVRD